MMIESQKHPQLLELEKSLLLPQSQELSISQLELKKKELYLLIDHKDRQMKIMVKK